MPRNTLMLYSLIAVCGVSGSTRWLFEEVLMNSCVTGLYVVCAGELVLDLARGALSGLAGLQGVCLDRSLGAQERQPFLALAVRPLAEQQALPHLQHLLFSLSDQAVDVCRQEAEQAADQSGLLLATLTGCSASRNRASFLSLLATRCSLRLETAPCLVTRSATQKLVRRGLGAFLEHVARLRESAVTIFSSIFRLLWFRPFGLLWQSQHLQRSEQGMPAWKHSQYFLRQWLLRQAQP